MEKIEPFDKFYSRYENWFEVNKNAYKSELLAIKKVIPHDQKTIEIGVGSARFASPLGVRIGIDPSKTMQKIAQKRGILIIDAVAENLPFRESTFNFALMVTTICFVKNIFLAFNEAFKILEPDGSLIIGFIDKNSPMGKLYQKIKNKNVFYKPATFYSVKEVIYYLKKVSFRSFEIFQTIFHSLKEIDQIEPIKEGHGEGSFVVIKATK
ncbi:MAG: class I SAM-dependent methyltransferase [Promethearchaeota archaeon]|nr:MAG: class I SAM-dependent methyltransferase [Candidatus Lokiarchaeota archaeon]